MPLIETGFASGLSSVDDIAAAQAVGDVDVIVEREPRMVGPQLLVALGETLYQVSLTSALSSPLVSFM